MDEENKPNQGKKPINNDIESTEEVEDFVDDVVPDTDVEGGIAFDATEKIKKLKEKLKACEAQKQEYLDGWQRSKADFINLRKRDEEDKKEFIKFANERLVEELIPVLDSFQMAFGNKEAWEKADKNWRMGVEYIHSQLISTLERHGIKEINPIGEKFDITRDEAVGYVPTEKESEDQTILAVTQKGYTLHGKTIRATKVTVGEYKKNF